MNLSLDKSHVYCHICNQHKKINVDLYIEDEKFKCLTCDTILGYTWDVYDKEEEQNG